MFGYVVPNKPEMKIREYTLYRSYYCGLCRELKSRYGKSGQMTLSYDTTFLAFLLTSLYEPEEEEKGMVRCMAHPLEKQPVVKNEYTAYAADINIILSYYSCEDDWNDEKKLRKKFLAAALKKKDARAEGIYPEKAGVITQKLDELHRYESEGCEDLDLVAGCFGSIMAEIFACRHDEWEQTLRRFGFFLGKFIYILDAYDDMDQDEKEGSYNPLLIHRNDPGFEEWVREILTMMMAECSKSFELLPIVNNVAILRNILYSGVWSRYDEIQAKKHPEGENGTLQEQESKEQEG